MTLTDFDERDSPSLQQQLLSAASEEELTRLLETHRSRITRDFALQGLADVRGMSSGPRAIPRSMLAVIAPRIVDVVEHIARFLADDSLRAECHFERSRVFAVAGRYEIAIDQLRAAAELWARQGDRLRQAQCIGQIGTFQLQLGLLDAAEASLNDSVTLLGAGETDQALLAPTYEELAQIAGRKHDLRAAAEYFSNAARIRLHQERYAQAAFDLQASVPMWLAVDEGRLAIENAEQFLQLRESQSRSTSAELDQQFADIVSRHCSELVARTTERRDRLYHADWQPAGHGLQQDVEEDGLDVVKRWITAAKRCAGLTKDPEPIARVHFAAAFLSLLDSDPAAAAEESALALPFFEGSADDVAYIAVLQTRARAELLLGRPEAAFSTLETALARVKAANRPRAALALQSLKVESLTVLGRLREAVDVLRDALDLARQTREPAYRYYEGSLLSSLGGIYQQIRQLESSIPIQLEALQIARELRSRVAEANQLASLGVLCGMLVTEWSRADLSLDRLWSLVESIAAAALPDSAGPWTIDASERRPNTFDQRARDLSRELLQRAAEMYRETGDVAGEAVTLGNLTNVFEGEDQSRIEALEEALGRLRQVQGTPRSEAILVANLGKSHLRAARVADARACFEYSLLLSESNSDYEWAYDTASDLAATYLEDGQFFDAVKYLRQAIDYTEAVRRGVPLGDAARTAFARDKQAAHARLARLYALHDRVADAYEVAQRAKSRALVESAALGTLSPTVPLTPELASLIEREGALQAELRARTADTSPLPRTPPARPLSELQTDIDATYERLQAIDPRYVSMRSGRPIRVRELKEILAAQGRPVLLVDYLLEENTLLIFLMRADWHSPQYRELKIDPQELASRRGEFERQVITYRGRGPQTWTSLGRIVLDPILDVIRENDLIYLVPHGWLHGLPIHALPVRGRPLMESHPVLYLPAASLLPICQAPGKSPDRLRACCAVGVEFEEEARSVASVFERSELITGDIDSSQIADATQSGWDVYHFSCHGYYDALDHRRSGLVLRSPADATAQTPEGVLTSEGIVGMRFDSELVCLSACQSGVGRVVQGDEQMGILRAFFLAGASSVMSTLWPVEAEATRAFMEAFYAHLLSEFRKGHIDKAAALQAAQLEIMRRHGPAGAYYWAPFVLSGDWK